ncbi:hypothetical protein B0A48_18033 [Cryoendolithus antarcticus]|uniref:Uncharacterized protein n=1 Tax=Cryoendolithus antarcticus TaxID=1507870 RepID=A0A1V8SA77_9PEZI|nr:hypothetical protein B0A48_18033 [Cryoendolithus antarcticus]
MTFTTRTADARFSTYSGAPSLQPSLAPTYSTTATTLVGSQPTRLSAPSKPLTTNPCAMYSSPYNPSTSTLNSQDPKTQDIKSWSAGFERMQDERLDKQRYVMSAGKSEEVSKVALGAKLERALGRRMTGQDATMRKVSRNEKGTLEVEVV